MPAPVIPCLTLALACLPASAVVAQVERAVQQEPIPTRVVPPPRVQPTPDASMDSQAAGARSANPSAAFVSNPPRPAASRVTVRHLYDTPANIRLRADLRTFYLPHASIPPVDPYSAAWALEGAYLARDGYDRRNLLRLYNFRDQRERAERLLTRHEQAVHDGLKHMRGGHYSAAIAAFSLAAELDHGDPACRIHLAQARLAGGRYEQAAAALREALELQPKLIYMDLDLDAYYPAEGALRGFTARLRGWLQRNRATPEAYFMLGYLSYQGGDYRTAGVALQRVAAVRPRDSLTRDLLELARPLRD